MPQLWSDATSRIEIAAVATTASHLVLENLQSVVLLDVCIARQQLRVLNQGCNTTAYSISTASAGAGCREGSGCTPTGWHRIAQKIGATASAGAIFQARKTIGKIAESLQSDDSDDLITSRILWLDGIESGHNRGGNVDSHRRFIYIHGTAQEHLIGQPVSHGCIRMCNVDVIELYDQVSTGSLVYLRPVKLAFD